MKSPNGRHFCVVGGGLAGTMLAARLCDLGQRVTLWDDARPHAATPVAAGLFNVITGRLGAKTWLADTLLAELRAFLALPQYAPLRQWVHFTDIYRPFVDVAEYNAWTARSAEAAYAPYVALQPTPLRPDALHNPLGGIRIRQCGWAEVSAIAAWLRGHLPMRLRAEPFGPHAARGYDHTILCTGAWAAELLPPGVEAPPIIPNKGELLVLHAPALALDVCLSRKIYCVPLGEGRYAVGATYHNAFADPHPSPGGRAEILRHFEAVVRVPYAVLGHRAGIRPTTPSRRPVVAQLGDRLHMFNGLGSKGMLYAPYFSRVLAQALVGHAGA